MATNEAAGGAFKGTPGSWRVEIDNVFGGLETNSVYVADCNPHRLSCPDRMVEQTNRISEANARAIAAVPEMIEALGRSRKALAVAIIAHAGGLFDLGTVGEHPVIAHIDAVLAKALGQ